MNKIEALAYLVENEVYSNEWSGAGMYSALSTVIRSNEIEFEKEFLDKLLDKAYNF